MSIQEEDDYGDMDDVEHDCHTCGGDGWVMSLAEESGDPLWDPDEPGECPNCGGSGMAKDCTYW